MREREAGLALRERRQAAIGVATEYNAEIVRLRALALAPAPEASIGSGLSGLGGGLSGGASKGAYLAAFLQRAPAPSKTGPTAAGRRQQMEARLVARVEARRARVKLAVGQHFTAAPESNDKDSPEDDTIAPPRKLPSALPVEAAHPGSVHAVALEGSLLKFRRHVGAWHKRYCVLYEDSCELTYYEGHAVAAWGRVYGKVSPPRARGAVTRDTLRRRVCQTARARRTGVQLDQARVAQDGRGLCRRPDRAPARAVRPQGRRDGAVCAHQGEGRGGRARGDDRVRFPRRDAAGAAPVAVQDQGAGRESALEPR